MVKYGFIGLFLIVVSYCSYGQSAAMYLCNDCTYESETDGQTITFNSDGSVKINGRFNKDFKCLNNDGIVELYYKDKLVNKLSFDFGGTHPGQLKDKRGILYTLTSCKGDMLKKTNK